jgi:hypothetical protein
MGLQTAVQSLQQFTPRVPGLKISEDFTGEDVWPGVRWKYSAMLTAELRGVQLVMWWPLGKKRLIVPAIYCPDMRTAVFCSLYKDVIRLCPRCKMPFVPDGTTTDYCTPAHGVAYRTARSRWNAKQRQKTLRGGTGAVVRKSVKPR